MEPTRVRFSANVCAQPLFPFHLLDHWYKRSKNSSHSKLLPQQIYINSWHIECIFIHIIETISVLMKIECEKWREENSTQTIDLLYIWSVVVARSEPLYIIDFYLQFAFKMKINTFRRLINFTNANLKTNTAEKVKHYSKSCILKYWNWNFKNWVEKWTAKETLRGIQALDWYILLWCVTFYIFLEIWNSFELCAFRRIQQINICPTLSSAQLNGERIYCSIS